MKPTASLSLSLSFSLLACAPTQPAPDGSAASDAAVAQDVASSPDAAPSAVCDEYCTVAAAHCDGANTLYATAAACRAACAGFSTAGSRGDRTGNTLWCRLYHVDQPASMDPATHCPHAGPSGGGVCQ
jgi:hypothetical protein